MALKFMGEFKKKRLALVIGNSTYEHAPELNNPRNDAKLISDRLKNLKFETMLGEDTDRDEISHLLSVFETKAKDTDVNLFYFAGHGLQVSGENYLLPIDSNIETPTHLKLHAIRLADVMGAVENADGTNIFILDACRNNPFARNIARSLGIRSEFVDRGLAQVPTARGSFIAFATRPGNIAQDGEGKNSPFTKALCNHIEEKDISISDTMIRVRNEVIQATNGLQEPWDESSLLKSFCFNPGGINTDLTNSGLAEESEPKDDQLKVTSEPIIEEKQAVENVASHPEQSSILSLVNSYLTKLFMYRTKRVALLAGTSFIGLIGAFLWLYSAPEFAEYVCRDSWFDFDGVQKCRQFFGADI